MAEPLPANILRPLDDLRRWLDAIRTPVVIVGGVAVSLLGRPRFTQDIDALAMIAEEDWEAALAAAPSYGLVPRINNPGEFARRTRVFLLRHVQSSIDIDVILGGLAFEQSAVDNGQTYEVGGISLRLPRVEDLMIMKAVAHRPQDQQDIEGLLEAHPDADIDAVRKWVGEFAAAAAMSDILEDFDKLVARTRRRD